MHDMCTVSLLPRPDIRSISRLPCLCDARDRSPGPQVYRQYRRKPAHDDEHVCVLTCGGWVWLCPHTCLGCVGALVGLCVRRRLTLPHTRVCSTISAGRLNFRVRDGSGCFPLAMATVTKPLKGFFTGCSIVADTLYWGVCVLGYFIVDAYRILWLCCWCGKPSAY